LMMGGAPMVDWNANPNSSANMQTPIRLCSTQMLKWAKNEAHGQITGGRHEEWKPCKARANRFDSLCSTHRRMINAVAKNGGSWGFDSIIKVPETSFEHPTCKFPIWFLHEELRSLPSNAAWQQWLTSSQTENACPGMVMPHIRWQIIGAIGSKHRSDAV
jgi:hypothetical protein